MKQKKYSSKMLPNVDYKYLYRDEGFIGTLTDLEFETKETLRIFSEETAELLKGANGTASIYTMIINLSSYLGFMTAAGLGQKEAQILAKDISTLITRETHNAYKLYEQFPITPEVGNEELRKKNLEKLRTIAPGSIVAQTLRLGRLILDVLDDIIINSPITNIYKSKMDLKEMFPPMLPFMLLLKITCKNNLRELRKQDKYTDYPLVLYHINHTAVQIGWLIGYFQHLFAKISIKEFLQYATSSMEIYIEHGSKYLKIPIKKLEDFINSPAYKE